MKKIFFLCIFIYAVAFAQDEKQVDQTVELPDFVITGVERIEMPKAQKPEFPPLSIAAKEFLKPVFPSDNLPLAELSNPIKKEISSPFDSNFVSGKLELAAGNYSLPFGRLTLGGPFEGGVFYAQVYGLNNIEHVENSGFNNSGLNLSGSFFVGNNSGFLPGSKFNLAAKYYRDDYNFYGSIDSNFSRQTHKANFEISFDNIYSDNFQIDVGFRPQVFYLKVEDYYENLMRLYGNMGITFEGFSIITRADMISQNLKNNPSNTANYNYFGAKSIAEFKTKEFISLAAGINYQKVAGDDKLSPVFKGGFRFSKAISLFGEFNQDAEFITNADFIAKNPYYIISEKDNFFYKKKANVKINFKYEYETYYEINGGFFFVKSDNYPYFCDTAEAGKFSIAAAKADKIGIFTNLLFHLGPFGKFYGDISLQKVSLKEGKHMPYEPLLSSNLSYSYKFKSGLLARAGLSLYALNYYSVDTDEKESFYSDLSLFLSHSINENFNIFAEANNILSSGNYYWRGYKAMPFNVKIGFEYIW